MKKVLSCFSRGEIILWVSSVLAVTVSFIIFGKNEYLTLCASIVGITSLIFNAKGHPFGQILMLVFAVLYGIISYTFAYYGEMITYLGMTAPMAVLSLISWLRNPFEKGNAQVKVNKIKTKEYIFLAVLTAAVTVMFYFILEKLNTANLIPSTVSVTTSFIAAYLTFRRSEYYALAYAANDIVLVVLWVMASITDRAYICTAVCFLIFLINDIYGFISWSKMRKKQNGDVKNARTAGCKQPE